MAAPRRPLEADVHSLVEDPLRLEDQIDPAAVIAALPGQSFVRVARKLREENRLELLLPFATPEQLSCLLDLDAWDADRIDLVTARQWLWAIVNAYSGASKPRGSIADLIYEMDPEIWTFALSADTHVIDLDPDDDGSRDAALDALAQLRTWATPDGFFIVGVPDDDFGVLTLETLSLVYADDLGQGRKLALSIQSGLMAQIEEDLLRWRSGRLADLGFASWEEARKLFRPMDHQVAARAQPRNFEYLRGEEEVGVAAFVNSELLRRTMLRLTDAEHGLRSREFLLLVSEVMAAQRFPPGNESLQQRAIEQTQSTVTLGLELLAAAQPEHPDPDAYLAARIEAIGMRDVFRVGYSALDKITRAANALHRTARISMTAPASLLDRPWGPALAAMIPFYPELPVQSTSSKTRPIASRQDVALATRLIAEAAALDRLTFAAEGFAVDAVWLTRVDEPERVFLGDLVRTAVIHTHLPGSRTPMAPLTADDLEWARDNLLDSGSLIADVTKDFSGRCDALGIGEHTNILAENLLTRLRVELLGLELPDLTKTGGLLTVQNVSMWLKTGGSRN